MSKGYASQQQSVTNKPQQANCKPSFNSGEIYLCSAVLTIPNPEGGNASNREAYLQLASYYGATSYSVELIGSSGKPVEFQGVQPIVDSTGRASDLFRRVQARIYLTDGGSKLPFPETALYVRDNLCKDFFVTNDPSDYDPNASDDSVACEPEVSSGP